MCNAHVHHYQQLNFNLDFDKVESHFNLKLTLFFKYKVLKNISFGQHLSMNSNISFPDVGLKLHNTGKV